MVPSVSTCARDGNLQCRHFARIAACAYNRRATDHPLRLAIRVRLHRARGFHLVSSLVDSVSTPAPEPLAQTQRIRRTQAAAAAAGRGPSSFGRSRPMAVAGEGSRLLDADSGAVLHRSGDLLRYLLAPRIPQEGARIRPRDG